MAFEPTEADQDALDDFLGGKARAAALTEKKRSEIAKAAQQTTMPTAVAHAMVVASGGIKNGDGG